MNSARKIYDEIPLQSLHRTVDGEIPAWKKKINAREKLLRAIRSKGFIETFRAVIRSEIKKGNPEDT
jgi:hypothetical protein